MVGFHGFTYCRLLHRAFARLGSRNGWKHEFSDGGNVSTGFSARFVGCHPYGELLERSGT